MKHLITILLVMVSLISCQSESGKKYDEFMSRREDSVRVIANHLALNWYGFTTDTTYNGEDYIVTHSAVEYSKNTNAAFQYSVTDRGNQELASLDEEVINLTVTQLDSLGIKYSITRPITRGDDSEDYVIKWSHKVFIPKLPIGGSKEGLVKGE